jgi:hypothetical protein
MSRLIFFLEPGRVRPLFFLEASGAPPLFFLEVSGAPLLPPGRRHLFFFITNCSAPLLP